MIGPAVYEEIDPDRTQTNTVVTQSPVLIHSLWDQEKRSKRNSSEIFGFFKKRLVEYSEIRNKLFTHKKIRNELWKSHWAKKPAVGWTQRPKTFLPKVARFFTQNMWPFQHFFLKVLHTLACQIIVQQNLIVFSKFYFGEKFLHFPPAYFSIAFLVFKKMI